MIINLCYALCGVLLTYCLRRGEAVFDALVRGYDLWRSDVAWLRHHASMWFTSHWSAFVGRDWIMESGETFAAWWSVTEVDRRKRAHVGRHRFENSTWRRHWAQYDTQWWPTLATSGDSWVVEPNMLPRICTRDLWTIWCKPTICLRDLYIHSRTYELV